MSFFELPPKPEQRDVEPTPRPAWAGPGSDELGVVIPFHLVVGENESALIRLQSVIAYTHGLVFDIAARAKREPVKPDPDEEDDLYPPRVDHSPHSPSFVRFGLQFRDGRKVTNLTPSPDWWYGDVSEPDGPVLIGDLDLYRYAHDGGVDLNYWLWPLPPGDTVHLVVEWPAEGITETATELETTGLLDAAARDTRF